MKKLLILAFAIFSFLIITQPVFAENLGGIDKRSLESANCVFTEDGNQIVTLDCLPILMVNGIYWMLIFSTTVALFLIIFGGFKYMTSGGDPKSVDAARKVITWAIIGLVVVLFSFAILAFIADSLGLGCIARLGFTSCGGNLGGGGGGGGGVRIRFL